MKKQYKLLLETAGIPKGTIVTLQSNGLFYADEDEETQHQALFRVKHIENRPTVWELIEEEKVENEYLPFVPKMGEIYWYVVASGCVFSDIKNAPECSVDTDCIAHGVFRTEQGAKYEALRRESMSKRYLPNYDSTYYWYDFCTKRYREDMYVKDTIDSCNYLIGNCHKSEEDCKQWADQYAEAWEVLL